MFEVTLIPIKEFNSRPQGTYLAIAIKEFEEDQRHIGIIHKDRKGSLSILHLEFHCILSSSSLSSIIGDEYFVYLLPFIDVERVRTIAGLCRQIERRKPEIPYGIVFNHSRFSKDGLLHLGSKSHGLTCATFVMAVFLSAGIDLLDEANWPHREEDDAWHQKIVNLLEKHKSRLNISEEHIENIKREKGCARFRPEEVAASFSQEETPVSFEFACSAGLIFIDNIRKFAK